MIPVMQSTFYEPDVTPDKQRGNCLTAVVASLMDLPIDGVPDFVQDDVDHDVDRGWDWWARLQQFVCEHGSQVEYLRVEGDETTAFRVPEPEEFYAVIGLSPRDPKIHHIVIYRDGQMVHDPHPDRTGLVKVTDTYHWTIARTGGTHE